jgi:hypothetical protein
MYMFSTDSLFFSKIFGPQLNPQIQETMDTEDQLYNKSCSTVSLKWVICMACELYLNKEIENNLFPDYSQTDKPFFPILLLLRAVRIIKWILELHCLV